METVEKSSNNMDHISGGSTASPSFACGMCGKCFCDAEQMKIHIQTHTGKQPFRCIICWPLFYDVSSSQVPEPSPMMVEPTASPTTRISHLTSPPATDLSHSTALRTIDTFNPTTSATTPALQEEPPGNSATHAAAGSGKGKSAEQTEGRAMPHSDLPVGTGLPVVFHATNHANSMPTKAPKSVGLVETKESQGDTSFEPVLEKGFVEKTLSASTSQTQTDVAESHSPVTIVSTKAQKYSSSVDEERKSQTSCLGSAKTTSTLVSGQFEDAHILSTGELLEIQSEGNTKPDSLHSSSGLVKNIPQHSHRLLPVCMGVQTVAASETSAFDPNIFPNDSMHISLDSTMNQQMVAPNEESSSALNTDGKSLTNCGRRKKGRPKRLAGDVPVLFYQAERLHQEETVLNDHMYSVSLEREPGDHQKSVETQAESSKSDDNGELEINNENNALKTGFPQEFNESLTVTIPLKTDSRKASQNLRKVSPPKLSVNEYTKDVDANDKGTPVSFQGVINFLKNVQVTNSSATQRYTRSKNIHATRPSTRSVSEVHASTKPLSSDPTAFRKRVNSSSAERLSPRKPSCKKGRGGLGNKPVESNRENQPVNTIVGSSSCDRRSPVRVLTRGRTAKTPKKMMLQNEQKSTSQIAETVTVEETLRRPGVEHGNNGDVSNPVHTSKQSTLSSAKEGISVQKNHLINSSPTRLAAKQSLHMARVGQEAKSHTISVTRQATPVAENGMVAQKTGKEVVSESQGTDFENSTADGVAQNQTKITSKSHVRKPVPLKGTKADATTAVNVVQNPAEVASSASVNSKMPVYITNTNTRTCTIATVAGNIAGVTSKVSSSSPKGGQDKLKEITGLSIPEVIAAARVAKGSTRYSTSGAKTRVIIVSSSAPQSPPVGAPVLASVSANACQIPVVTSCGNAAKVVSTANIHNTLTISKTCQPESSQSLSSQSAGQPFSTCTSPISDTKETQSSVSTASSKHSVIVNVTSSGVSSTVNATSSVLSVTSSDSLGSLAMQQSRIISAEKNTASPRKSSSSVRHAVVGPEALKPATKTPVVSLARIEDSAVEELTSGKFISVTLGHTVEQNLLTDPFLIDIGNSRDDRYVNDLIYPEAAKKHRKQDAEMVTESETRCKSSTEGSPVQKENQTSNSQTTQLTAVKRGPVKLSDSANGLMPSPDLGICQTESSGKRHPSEVLSQISTDFKESPTRSRISENVSDTVTNTVSTVRNTSETLSSNIQKQGPKRRIRKSAEKQLVDFDGVEFNLQELFNPVHKLRKRYANAGEFFDGELNSESNLDTDLEHNSTSSVSVDVHLDSSHRRNEDGSSLSTFDKQPLTSDGETHLTSYCHSLSLMPNPHMEAPQSVQMSFDTISKHQQIRQARDSTNLKQRTVKCHEKSCKASVAKSGNSLQTRPAAKECESRRNKVKQRFCRKLKTCSHLRTTKVTSHNSSPQIFTLSVAESVKQAERKRKSVMRFHPTPDLETTMAQIAQSIATSSVSKARSTEANCAHHTEESRAGELSTPTKADVYPNVRVTPGHFSLGKISQYICKTCGAKFKKHSKYLFHKKNHGKDRFRCDICGVTLGRRESLKAHKMIHTGEAAANCDVCGKTLCSQQSLATHMRIHTDERPYSCPLCPKTFRQQPGLVSHYRTHTRDRPFKCNVCGKSYRFQKNLYNHRFTHTGERRYVCKICRASYYQLTGLNVHYRLHRGEKPFGCDYCSMHFLQKVHMQKHVRRVHQDQLRAKEEASVKNVGKPFHCNSCSRGFTTVRAMQRHKKEYCIGLV